LSLNLRRCTKYYKGDEMRIQLKFLIPLLAVIALFLVGVGFAITQNSAVSAANSSVSYQANGDTLNCGPGDCQYKVDGTCPQDCPTATRGFRNCHGQSQITGATVTCPCGGSRAAQ